MSKADEMFEKLGYTKQEDEFSIFYYQNNIVKQKYGFDFYKDDKEIYPVCYARNEEPIYITIQELQAINEKVKELGWNE